MPLLNVKDQLVGKKPTINKQVLTDMKSIQEMPFHGRFFLFIVLLQFCPSKLELESS